MPSLERVIDGESEAGWEELLQRLALIAQKLDEAIETGRVVTFEYEGHALCVVVRKG